VSLFDLDAVITGSKDFAAKLSRHGTSRKKVVYHSENIGILMDQIRLWLGDVNAKLINIQTVDHYAYYRCAVDNPGKELYDSVMLTYWLFEHLL
jgi:hypothetical protein